ncbi:hypothetical protein QYF61_019227 [Mycteria americana]|uniref:Uncharacterized protein n=1 Tax=Mycteria americana TaxID=33587 RepID=A0AAN7S9E8_MYCAM|nr:hypothetical protein QYF61_019227 [Mycteria americana]
MVVTGFQLDFVPPITTLWAWLFSQFSHLTVCSNSPYSFSFSVRIWWETVSKAFLKSSIRNNIWSQTKGEKWAADNSICSNSCRISLEHSGRKTGTRTVILIHPATVVTRSRQLGNASNYLKS